MEDLNKNKTVAKALEEVRLINDARECIKNKIVGIEIYNTLNKLYAMMHKYQGQLAFYNDNLGRKIFSVKIGDPGNHLIKAYYDPDNFESFIVTLESVLRWAEMVAATQPV